MPNNKVERSGDQAWPHRARNGLRARRFGGRSTGSLDRIVSRTQIARLIAAVGALVAPGVTWAHSGGEDEYVTFLSAPIWLALWTLIVAMVRFHKAFAAQPFRKAVASTAVALVAYGTIAYALINISGWGRMSTLAYYDAVTVGVAAYFLIGHFAGIETQGSITKAPLKDDAV